MERLPMTIVVSLDGADAETYESIRLGADFDSVLQNLDRFREYARRHGTEVHLTHCLMTSNWHRFAEFLRFADSRDLPVGVNTVTSPIEHSLHHLHPDRLSEIVETWEAIDADVRRDLRLNGHVWTDQLTRLRHRLEALARFDDVDYYLGRTIVGIRWRRPPDDHDGGVEAQAILDALDGSTLGPVVIVDDTEHISDIEPRDGCTSILDMDLTRTVGLHVEELTDLVTDRTGADVVELVHAGPDLRHRRMSRDDGRGVRHRHHRGSGRRPCRCDRVRPPSPGDTARAAPAVTRHDVIDHRCRRPPC